jgi:hypothetical protein
VGVHDLDLGSMTYLSTRVSHRLTKLNTKQATYVLVYKCKALLGILFLSQRVNQVSCRLTVWAVLPLFIISLWPIFFFHVLGSRLGGIMVLRVPQDAGVASIEIIIACMNWRLRTRVSAEPCWLRLISHPGRGCPPRDSTIHWCCLHIN